MIRKILCFLVLMLPGFLPGLALAYTEHAPDNGHYRMAFDNAFGEAPEPQAACAAFATHYSLVNSTTITANTVIGSGTSYTCSWHNSENQNSMQFPMTFFAGSGCHEGESINPETGMCLHPEPEDFEICPPGQTPGPSGICDATDPDEEPCESILGYVNGQPICADDQEECEATGGAFGTINGIQVCVPPEEEPPPCIAGTFLFANATGDYVCVTSGDPPPDPDDPADSDDDGEPDVVDDDIDGDGDPNDTDPDRDGDGRPNGSDPSPNGNEPDADSDGDGVPNPVDDDPNNDGNGPCDASMRDYAQCVGQLETASDSASATIRAGVNSGGNVAVSKIGAAATTALGNGQAGITGPTGIESTITGLSLFAGASCVDIVIPIFLGESITILCSDTALLRTLLGYALAVMTLFSIFSIATQRSSQ